MMSGVFSRAMSSSESGLESWAGKSLMDRTIRLERDDKEIRLRLALISVLEVYMFRRLS